jgi:Saxitoxin biosynthesis operon protein SxtJ
MISAPLPEESTSVVPDRTLREFAALLVVILGFLFAWSWYRRGIPSIPASIGVAMALFVGVPGLVAPAWVRPWFLFAVAVTKPIGHVMSTILLALVYYGLFTPVGLILRAAGHDPLLLRKPVLESYWVPVETPTDVRRYLHQYQSQRRAVQAPQNRAQHATT